MTKQKAKLEKWSVIGIGTDPYKAPEQAAIVLSGVVEGHPKISDGTEICTSPLTMISYRNKVALTTNTAYELGEPSPDFLRWCSENNIRVEEYEIGRMDS
jgi:hypothetical protein